MKRRGLPLRLCSFRAGGGRGRDRRPQDCNDDHPRDKEAGIQDVQVVIPAEHRQDDQYTQTAHAADAGEHRHGGVPHGAQGVGIAVHRAA